MLRDEWRKFRGWFPLLAIHAAMILGPAPSVAAELLFVEVRRTFASPHCDSGEVYVDGVLVSLFLSDPRLFAATDLASTVLTGEFSTSLHGLPRLFNFPEQAFVLTANDGSVKLRMSMLNSATFSPFDRRELTRQLSSIDLVLGYSVLNRTCEVTASSAITNYNDGDRVLEDTSGRMGAAILSEPNLKSNFPSTQKRTAVVVLADRAHRLEIKFSGRSFVTTFPARGAEAVGPGDVCLQSLEHGANTIHRPGGVTYERRDRVVTCTTGALNGAAAIEQRRDVRFISFQERVTCATFLGLPFYRTWHAWRGSDDIGGPVYENCTNQDWKKAAETGTIVIR